MNANKIILNCILYRQCNKWLLKKNAVQQTNLLTHVDSWVCLLFCLLFFNPIKHTQTVDKIACRSMITVTNRTDINPILSVIPMQTSFLFNTFSLVVNVIIVMVVVAVACAFMITSRDR